MAAAAFAAAASAGASAAPTATSDEDVRHLRETILKLEAQVKALTDVAYGESFRLDDGSHGRHAAPAPHGSATHGDDGSVAPRESSGSPDSERLAPMWSSVPAELMAMSDGASSTGGMLSSPTLRPMKTAFADGTTVSVRPDETAVMKAVFDMLDENKDGTVAKTELQELHRRLGEHVEEDELDAALKATGADGDTVDFPTFMRLWQGSFAVFYEDSVESEALEKKRQRYQARFQMLKARVANPEVGRITTRPSGTPGTLGYRVHFFYRNSDGTEKQISPWHDIPLRNPDKSYNFICEIPKWTRAKFEIATDEPFNPIKQDTRNGVLRDYNDMAFNYGAFPQTWEDPHHVTPETGAGGDNDPIDAIEIGQRQWGTGAVVRVKVLGVVALIDSGETDWKVVTISVEDPMASRLDDIDDVYTHMPGAIESFIEWLRLYKSHKGVVNEFGFEDKPQARAYTETTIAETHAFWKKLVAEKGGAACV